MTSQIFLDECKRDGYVVAITVVPVGDVTAIRATMRGLLLPQERSLHFNSEKDGRRRSVLATLRAVGVTAAIYRAQRRRELEARLAILDRVVNDGAELGVTRLVIERDDSTYTHDVRQVRESRAKAGAEHKLDFEAVRRGEEPMLWIPDAIAWAWTKRGEWRERVKPLVYGETVV